MTNMGRKQICGRFKRLISIISLEKTWMWLRIGNLKREREFLLIAARNNTTRTNNIKARIDKTQQKSKGGWCGDWDETTNHIINEFSKSAPTEYKTRNHWIGKVIHWELCKKFKFKHMNKWYMHNPSWVLEDETHKLIWFWHPKGSPNLGQTTRHLIIIKKKRTCKIVEFAVTADYSVKLKESEKKNKYLDWTRVPKHWINNGTRGLGNKRMSKDHPNYCIPEIRQNNQMSSGH